MIGAMKPILFHGLFACVGLLPLGADEPFFDERVVFTSGAEGYDTIRIPAIVTANNGDLLAFAEGRVESRRDHDNVDLILKRSTDNGATWGPLQVVWGKDDHGLITWGNPCPVIDRRNGRVWLAMCWENYKVFVVHSDDHGATWSVPRDITADIWNPAWARPPGPILTIWTGPGIGIQVERGPHAGRLVIPVHLRQHPLRKAEFNEAACFYSDDGGATWRYGEGTTGFGNEPAVVELTDGRLMLNQRHYMAVDQRRPGVPRYRLISYSDDGGATWTPSKSDDELTDPSVQASMLRYVWGERDNPNDRGVLLFSNPGDPGRRARLTVRASFDDGATWPVQRVVQVGDSAYSSLTRQADGLAGLLYEAGRYGRFLVYARFNLAWLRGGSEVPAAVTEHP